MNCSMNSHRKLMFTRCPLNCQFSALSQYLHFLGGSHEQIGGFAIVRIYLYLYFCTCFSKFGPVQPLDHIKFYSNLPFLWCLIATQQKCFCSLLDTFSSACLLSLYHFLYFLFCFHGLLASLLTLYSRTQGELLSFFLSFMTTKC